MKTTIFKSWMAWLILAGLVLYQPFVTLQAATITVCASGCDQTDVQAAIDIASPGDTVQIDGGVYPANLTIAKDITLQGQSAEQTILDGQQKGTVVNISTVSTVELRGLTVRNGAVGIGDAGRFGGGIYNKGNLTIADCIVTDNHLNLFGLDFGGGIANDGNMDIVRSTISNNSAAYGGAIWASGLNTYIRYSAIINNQSGVIAGGIYFAPSNLLNAGNFNILQSTLSGNGQSTLYLKGRGVFEFMYSTINGSGIGTLVFDASDKLRIGNTIIT